MRLGKEETIIPCTVTCQELLERRLAREDFLMSQLAEVRFTLVHFGYLSNTANYTLTPK